MAIKVCVFDAYGTLFDVAAAARIAAEEPGNEDLKKKWKQIANTWRLKQLQYTWLRALTGQHTDFWTVTQNGLDFALEEAGLSGKLRIRDRLLQLYWELAAFEEVPAMLQDLKALGYQTAILSNGSPDMLQGAVNSAGLTEVLDDVLSVESVGIFKPAPQVYQLVLDRFKCQKDEVLFVSSNGWDASAASGFGFRTLWVNRAGDPMDQLPAKPNISQRDLTEVAEVAQALG